MIELIPDSSDDDGVKYSPDYVGSQRGWMALLHETKRMKSWTDIMIKRYGSKCYRGRDLKRRMHKMISNVNLTKHSWVSSVCPVFEEGSQVIVASDKFATNRGKILKRIMSKTSLPS